MTNYEYCYIINDDKDNTLGFGVLAPSLNNALKNLMVKCSHLEYLEC